MSCVSSCSSAADKGWCFFDEGKELLIWRPLHYMSYWTVSLYLAAELQVYNCVNVSVVDCLPALQLWGWWWWRRSVTGALCESWMLASPGALLMMKAPLRLGKLCRSPDRSVDSEDGGAAPRGWQFAHRLRSPSSNAGGCDFSKSGENLNQCGCVGGIT